MKKLSLIGGLLKRLHRVYGQELLRRLQERGFTDLRPSFLEVLLYICEHEGSVIKQIGEGCGLKKQTMTSHLNELEKRGYLLRKISEMDKREQKIFLTEYGEKFKFNLFQALEGMEREYIEQVGEVELERIGHILTEFHHKVHQKEQQPRLL